MPEKNKKKTQDSWSRMNASDVKASEKFNAGYIAFLSRVKTEREAVAYISEEAFSRGFKEINQVKGIKPGDKLMIKLKSKVAALIVVGKEPLEKGVNIIASHIDSPRLDLKPHPAYEADGMALFKTHYYGGIKKYQWLAIPLALHGVVAKKDGRIIDICIGEKADDPVFTIADLLPHLSKDQMEKKMAEAISGESLNALLGSRPLNDKDEEAIKARLMGILKDQYDIEEDDFTSAELQFVPAFPARDLGLDRSMIAAYGLEDRVSAYASLRDILELEKPERTALCLFVDKEEIGSVGNTGLQSLLIENVFTELMNKAGHNDYFSLRQALASSAALSADVNAAVEPNYPEVFEKMNCSVLSRGVVVTKYTGSRGKYDSNDANPEFMARIRKIFDEAGVVWQVGELGKVDIGGGGTVAQYIARYGMEVVDCGVAILGMHSPFEVASKADTYMSYKGYRAFLQNFV
jgi:aspartyl aminopeptidase